MNDKLINEPKLSDFDIDGDRKVDISALDDVSLDMLVDHSKVSIVAGDGLSGGGNILTNKTLVNMDKGTTAKVAHESAYNHDLFLTSELDPIFDASPAAGISSGDITNWDSDHAKIINQNVVHVADYGAVGDGTTDDTSAIAAAIAAGRTIIFDGTKTYKCKIDISSPYINLVGNGCVLKGISNNSYIMYITKGFHSISDFTLSMVDMTNSADTYGLKVADGYCNSFRSIRVIYEPALAFGLRIETGTYTSHFDTIEANGVSIVGTEMGDAVTTITLTNLDFEHGYIRYVQDINFVTPIMQGTTTKLDVDYAYNVYITGGDIEGSGDYLVFGDNCLGIYSIGNNLASFSGTYKNTTPVSSFFMDTHANADPDFQLCEWMANPYIHFQAGKLIFESQSGAAYPIIRSVDTSYAGQVFQNTDSGKQIAIYTSSDDGILRIQDAGETDHIQIEPTTGDITLDGRLTTGSLLAADPTLFVDNGTNRIGMGTLTPDTLVHLMVSDASALWHSDTVFAVEKNGNSFLSVGGNANSFCGLLFSDPNGNGQGQISYDHSTDTLFLVSNGSVIINILSDGKTGIGCYPDSPNEQLEVNGKIRTNYGLVSYAEIYFASEINNGDSGNADTIDWTAGNKQKSTLTNDCTFTFTPPSGPCNLVLKLIQDETGSRIVTWPNTVKWPNGTPPTLSTIGGYIDIICFYFDGANYFGNASLAFS